MKSLDSFKAHSELTVGSKKYKYYNLKKAAQNGLEGRGSAHANADNAGSKSVDRSQDFARGDIVGILGLCSNQIVRQDVSGNVLIANRS